VGARTQNAGTTRHFETLYFDIPENSVSAERTIFRLISKKGDEVNAYRLWMYKVEGGRNQSLPEMLGLAPNAILGKVSHGLIPKGGKWKSPVVLSQHGDQAALIMQKIGKGFLIRSELTLEDSIPILKSLLSTDLIGDLGAVWDKF
jgi:hypothetical protein